MKKYLLSIAFLLTVCIFSAKAQINLGIKGGINFSQINLDNFSKSTRTGYQAGVFGRIGSSLFLQPELYLSSTGGNFTATSTSNFTAKVNFTNLSLPVLVGYSFPLVSSLNLHLMAGPVYTYALNKSASFSDNANAAIADFGNYKNSTLGFQAGGGAGIGSITADLRYEGGLTKINNNFGQHQHLWALSVAIKIL